MEPSEIIEWALSRGFRQTGPNAYSAMHEGKTYQMLLRQEGFVLQRRFPSGGQETCGRTSYDSLHVDEHGMLQGAGLAEAFARAMRRGGSAPAWFTPEYTAHVLEVMIPEWEEKIASMGPRP